MKSLKGIFVFLGSPGDLKKERDAFKEVIYRINIDCAIDRQMILIPVIYEDLESTAGTRNQTVINNQLLGKCDFVLCMFWKTLGRPSTNPEYESNTVEEYYTAKALLEDNKITKMGLMFRKIPDDLLADPEDNVKKVIEFKKKIEGEDNCIYKPFDDEQDFKQKIRSQLDKWLNISEGIKVASPTQYSAIDESKPEDQVISDIIES